MEELARASQNDGDPRRGAVIFYRRGLACANCHEPSQTALSLGPDLSKPGRAVASREIVEAILEPSKTILKGFESTSILTKDGKTLTGRLLVEKPDAIVLLSNALLPEQLTVPKEQIEERKDGGLSLMPAGLANQIETRQNFLDLVSYLADISANGPARARSLKPSPELLADRPLPAYEASLDHSGILSSWDDVSLERGEVIYNRVCANCHGDQEKPGSLPASLRFASGKFKNGSDPYRMYQTLTRGFGQMPPQTWMVPQQKYDVIHYIREKYVKESNPSQYSKVDESYLASLPKGTTRGPEPSSIEPWVAMNYGPSLSATIEVGEDGSNYAYKGIAVRLDEGLGGVSRGRAWSLFDHDTLRLAAFWTGVGFIDWEGINFNGKHQVHPRIAGLVQIANPIGPGWGNPETGSFEDPRPLGRDNRPYGPLPREWAHLKGVAYHSNRVVVAYSVGTTNLLESTGIEGDDALPILTRTFEIGPRAHDLVLQVAHISDANLDSQDRLFPGSQVVVVFGSTSFIAAAVLSESRGFAWISTGGNLRLVVPKGPEPVVFKLAATGPLAKDKIDNAAARVAKCDKPGGLTALTKGGPPRWPDVLHTQSQKGSDSSPFAVDVLSLPDSNPWFCQVRTTGLDFLPQTGAAVLCTWDGDVWRVDGLNNPEGKLSWRRIASGLFQPLGIKVVEGKILVSCRDQIVVLHDLNNDGEIDFYENFNNDHQVTDHFHEFAMDLQTDSKGNFYYAKAARHGLQAVVPQHGTLLRVSPDGSRTDILATGFRAPNGVCVNPDGTFFMTDQEGFWLPKNRINWVKPGSFHGNMWGYHNITDASDSAMEQPLCWITNRFDRSPAEIVRVESQSWGSLNGALLNLSYGNGKIFIVPHELVGGKMQGGMAALPIQALPTGVMRGRFSPEDGQLYCCGMFAWAGDATNPGGFYRIRKTGKPEYLPVGLSARRDGMAITFTNELDRSQAMDRQNFKVNVWSLKRSKNYGSDHIDEHPLEIAKSELLADGKTVFLSIPRIEPTWCMSIIYTIKGRDGSDVLGEIHNTIHELGESAAH